MLLNDDTSVAESVASNLLELTQETKKLMKSECDADDRQANEVNDEWNKYRIIEILGEGSYGKVYKVQRLIPSEDIEQVY